MNITHHRNSILNPDEVKQWAADEPAYITDRAERSAALLPAVARFFSDELPRAEAAARAWA